MMWVPRGATDPDDRPIVLVTDRRRFWIAAIPMVLVFLIAGVLFLMRASPILAILELVLVFAAYRYAAGGKSGDYEVRQDGSLGDFLGRRMPAVLRDMERMKP